jgi:predicted nuclease of predicted toxin-antitoxin system
VRLLFDQHLSARLIRMLADVFPYSAHVRLIGLQEAEDEVIWEYAAQHGFTIVSKDADFRRLSARLGASPRVVLLRCGNCPTSVIEAVLRTRRGDVDSLISDRQATMLVID